MSDLERKLWKQFYVLASEEIIYLWLYVTNEVKDSYTES